MRKCSAFDNLSITLFKLILRIQLREKNHPADVWQASFSPIIYETSEN